MIQKVLISICIMLFAYAGYQKFTVSKVETELEKTTQLYESQVKENEIARTKFKNQIDSIERETDQLIESANKSRDKARAEAKALKQAITDYETDIKTLESSREELEGRLSEVLNETDDQCVNELVGDSIADWLRSLGTESGLPGQDSRSP